MGVNTNLDISNKNNSTVVPIPPNFTAWLQPCDVLVGSAKNNVRNGGQSSIDKNIQYRTCS